MATIQCLQLDWDIETNDGEVIAHIPMFTNQILTSEYNARLIAAAPDLLEAARVLAEGWMQRNHPESPGVTITDSQMADAAYAVRAVIAKVTGE